MATIAENLQIIKDSTDDIRQAILDNGGQITGGIATYADSISNLLPKESDVIFYDYDGTVLYSYTRNKFLSLTSLPDLPSHDGLICQGWNYTFDDAIAYVQEYGKLDIGATYITDDGKTRLYINLLNDEMNTPIYIYINQSIDNGVVVDWGDGTNAETVSGTGNVTFNRIYSEAGSYTITLTVNSGTCILGHNEESYNMIGSLSTMGPGSLYKVEIGSNTSIGNYAFRNCHSLTSITLPNSVTSIGGWAFKECYSLQAVTIPNSVTSIDTASFLCCTSLQSVTIPNSVISIGESAFGCCTSLQSITISDSVNSIEVYVFEECRSLKSITIPNSVISIGESTFQCCSSLQSVTIPDSVTNIGGWVFNACYALQSITISDSVNSIGEGTFCDCISLKSITLPNSVMSIGVLAFQYCYSLTSITLPNSVTSIGAGAFGDCYSIQYYDFTSHTSIPTLSYDNVFISVNTDCKIRVPAALYEEWKAATNWSVCADYIVPYEG